MASPKQELDVRILGPLDVVSDGVPLALGGHKQRTVLALLATRPGNSVSADELIESLWPERPPATATTTVQVYVSRLRKQLGAARIATTGAGYALRVEPDQVDAARFQRLTAAGRELRIAGRPSEAEASLREALSLWRGAALADFIYEPWAQPEAARLEEQRLACLEDRFDVALACGRDSDLVGELEALVAEHPLRERLRGQLMLALYRTGRQAEALEAYQRARSMLVEELGIEPSPELQELNRKILTQEVSPAAAPSQRALPTGTVTLMATDIEGSTRLLAELGAGDYAEALAEHRRVLRDAVAAHDGVEVDTQGDAFLVAFARASEAVAAASDAQRGLGEGPFRVRMGLHSGEPLVTAEGYVGIDVHQAARVMSAGHGGQVLISAATQALLDSSIALLDLGNHRLKDLTAAQRLFQLGDEQFPPLRTLHQANLPVQPTPLVGRGQELDLILKLLSEARLVTLTGAGGSGKTRLALQAAADLVDDYPHGVWWVSLAALRHADLVEPTIAQVVGASEGLIEHLRQRKTLLLLDNFEHLLDSAPRIAALLAEAPDVRVLATSRERLGIAAEHEYEVPTLIPVEAIALFTARARQLKRAFEPDETIAEICRRLDGLPLAVELAAARINVLTPKQMLERLGASLDLLTGGTRDAPERHRTLRATIEWSYDLLSDEERRLFARLAVFIGSFALEAAEAICDAAVDTFAGLVDKKLVRQRDDRFFLLETIREFAHAQLEASGDEADLRERHADFFVELAEQGDEGLRTSEQAAWLDRLDSELPNFRAALDWSLAAVKPDRGLRLCVALLPLWWQRDYLDEASRWFDLATSRVDSASPLMQGRVLLAAGSAALVSNQLDLDKAQALVGQALTLARDGGDRKTEADAVQALGQIARGRDDIGAAIEFAEEALELYREIDDVYWTANALHHLAERLRDGGHYPRARELFEESIGLWREAGCLLDAMSTIHALGDLSLDTGELDRARELYAESLDLAQQFRIPSGVAHCLAGLAAVAAGRSAFEPAARLWGAVEALESEYGVVVPPFDRRRYLRLVGRACESLPGALAAGRQLSLAEAVELRATLD